MSSAEAGRASFDLDEVLRGQTLLIASNRGPVAFEADSSGELLPTRGAGGLVTALTHVMCRTGGVWVASAMTPGDRAMVRRQQGRPVDLHLEEGGCGLRLRYLVFEREVFDRYYNRISNWILWFMQHGLWELPLQPRFDERTTEAWICYRAVNESFAEALAEEAGRSRRPPAIMLHDYHLMTAAGYLRKLAPEAFLYHFTHSPWAQPDTLRILPRTMAREVLEGMLANDLLGFHTIRWARNFMWCCQELLEAEVDFDEGVVRHLDRRTVIRHYPISIHAESVRAIASSEEAKPHLARLDRLLEGRRLIMRVDRLEPSKNVVRGLQAYETFLRNHPAWRGRVVYLALLYPSRTALREYREYEAEVLDAQDRINLEFGADDWTPVAALTDDNYVRALACLTRYDVLVVNPIADGMNLVAKEGPAVNNNDGVLILSQNAGAWFELGHAAITVNPYDVAELAEAIHAALIMEPGMRRDLATVLRRLVEGNDPSKWIWHQLEDIRRLREGSEDLQQP
ncbi:MAG: alpha,alpha-trehalose-phosphate synthase (UDP-forming) [Actinomycetota bacterium]